ncbi:CcdB family protein [Mesorhizobium sp. LHD-90]|uniref:CcdB family protein n=1 Tax=Mesorhizobium sp. LHD-90 TaxID=3071414 RepID=UPI0027E078A0|nr:CcdB family protein [Mesorhizobium sp. LHD-90]MDQ6437029.1 CcdB family protein [Mesorhizobium sp. LHD-90]
MAKYDVFPSPSGDGFLLELQADLLSDLNTRVVAPLLPASVSVKAIRRLNPAFIIDGRQYVMFTHLIATIPASRLPEPITNFARHGDDIAGALEMLFQGF